MNIIDIQDQLKNFSENQLIQEMQMPSGNAPQFLVLSEIQRRKRVRDSFAQQQAANEPTVAEEAVAAAGVPMQGIAGMSEAMAPQSAASGGIGTIMPQSMRQAAPAPDMNPEEMAMGMAGGGLLDSLFKGRESLAEASNRPEIRITKDGRKAMYKPGTNIFLGFVNEDKKMAEGGPLGLRQFNPGNIRPGAGFLGETGVGGGYAQFESPEYGLRALSRLLGTYGQKRGVNTLRGLVSRYAPKSDNPESFENYIKYMSDKLGVDPDEEIDLAGRRAELIPAIVGFEQGQQPFSEDQISRAITASQTDDPDEVSSILNAPLNEVLADRGVNSSDLFQQDVDPGLMSAMAASGNPEDNESGGVLDFLNRNILGPKGRELIGTEIESDFRAKEGARSAEQFGEREKYERELAITSSPEYQDMIRRSETSGERPLTPNEFISSQPFARRSGEKIGDRARYQESLREDMSDEEKKAADAAESSATNNQPSPPASPAGTDNDGTAREDTSIEAEILKMQDDLRKGREQDKWLAIAQAGLALMSSKEPTLLGAAGEAGVSGLKAFREAQDRYQEGVIDLVNARAKLEKNEGSFTVNQRIQRASDLRAMAKQARELGQEGKARQYELAADSLLSSSGVIGSRAAGVIPGLADQ